MKEIEIKILEVDSKKIIKQLKAFGAKLTYDGGLEVIFYDFEDNKLRAEDKRLRLRQFDNHVELTFKHKLSSEKALIAEEHQVIVDNFKIAQEILSGLNLKKTREYKKHRTSYTLGKVFFDIDKIGDCPAYLEIEAPSVKEVYKWVKKLGFNKKDVSIMSGREVAEYYKGKI